MPIEPDIGEILRSFQTQIDKIKNRAMPTAGSTQLRQTIETLQETVDGLANRAVRAASVSSTLTLTSTTATSTTIKWDAAATPEVTFNTPSSLVLVTVGTRAVANVSTPNAMGIFGHLGISVNGVTPDTTKGAWPWMVSDSYVPTTAELSYTKAVVVTPGINQTIAARFGYNNLSDSPYAGMTVDFSNRFITVTPIP